jgi:hypothetical protein
MHRNIVRGDGLTTLNMTPQKELKKVWVEET